YTRGLLECIPRPIAPGQQRHRLYTIPGNVPSILSLPKGCKFCTRCPVKLDICETVEPPLLEISPNHFVRCHLAQPMEGGARYE
ncbi:MAG: peptide ABC transporter ATP-binding protein, partial [Candidatus Kapabacteria bacterium]|nr:peptide ABC transporter ATP-binding protein [Candidatus Kapabacteria bacterium]MDW7996714.1 peptide ABC transporter ATP-binding protein [Bacteroidota bacterium]